MAVDTKENWVVVKFVVAATGFKRKDARVFLGQIPKEFHAQVFMAARAWEHDASMKAAETLSVILQAKPPKMITDTVKEAATRFGGRPQIAHASDRASSKR